LGYGEKEILGQRADILFTPEDKEQAVPEQEMQTALRTGRTTDNRWHLKKDGKRFWATGTMMLLNDAADGLQGFLKIMRDRTEERGAEQALQESEARLSLTLQAGNLGIWDSDLIRKRTYWSPEQEKLFGLAPGEFNGHFSERVHPEDRVRVLRKIAEVKIAGKDYQDEFRVLLPDGSICWLAGKGSVIRDIAGRAVRLMGVNFDITERQQTLNALRESNVRLRDLTEQQQRFVADAAHELRAPLTSIRGNLDLMTRYQGIPLKEQQEMLDDLHQETLRLSRLVEDMLELARGDSGLKMRKYLVNVADLLLAAWHTVQKFNMTHTFELENMPSVYVLGDTDRLKQLALILLENAVKYTPEGGTISMGLSQTSEYATFYVRDSGIGIAREDVAHVFERFYRADKARTRAADPGGTGLGLSIADWIVTGHRGEIWLESELGQGTTVWVKLPLALA
jgi:PAS domain S-box-containing protein